METNIKKLLTYVMVILTMGCSSSKKLNESYDQSLKQTVNPYSYVYSQSANQYGMLPRLADSNQRSFNTPGINNSDIGCKSDADIGDLGELWISSLVNSTKLCIHEVVANIEFFCTYNDLILGKTRKQLRGVKVSGKYYINFSDRIDHPPRPFNEVTNNDGQIRIMDHVYSYARIEKVEFDYQGKSYSLNEFSKFEIDTGDCSRVVVKPRPEYGFLFH